MRANADVSDGGAQDYSADNVSAFFAPRILGCEPSTFNYLK